MSILFNCTCGRPLRIRDENLRGQKVKCPACDALVIVPGDRQDTKEKTEDRKKENPSDEKKKRPRRRRRPRRRKPSSSQEDKPQEDRPKQDTPQDDKPKQDKPKGRRQRDSYGRSRSGRRDRERHGKQPQEMAPTVVGAGADKTSATEEKAPESSDSGKGLRGFIRRLFDR